MLGYLTICVMPLRRKKMLTSTFFAQMQHAGIRKTGYAILKAIQHSTTTP
jgi:hypothetical protein